MTILDHSLLFAATLYLCTADICCSLLLGLSLFCQRNISKTCGFVNRCFSVRSFFSLLNTAEESLLLECSLAANSFGGIPPPLLLSWCVIKQRLRRISVQKK
ncbi:hypothetical protein CEXT_27181 [Caerostris extrusa]|uniref:Secreted protein n=1 Tax=Caerostris extrusa TaxID=172846 RepID=A0AAV4QVQ9_CAEEX|nr:hypothetical protein CEXT_27181 [Caerostris extrusa]